MKYKVDISADVRGSYVSLSWEEDFTRDDVRNFFSPSDGSFNSLIYPPEAEEFLEDGEPLTDDERTELEEEIQRQALDFEWEKILPDSLKFWMEDLTEEYRRVSQGLPGHEDSFREIQAMTDKQEAVRKMYELVGRMKPRD